MWQGIRTIADYKSNSVCLHGDVALTNELNTFSSFFARFEVDDIMTSAIIPAVETEQTLTLSTHKVQCNPRKAEGPDGVPGQVLTECAGQLAEVFTSILNLSLA